MGLVNKFQILRSETLPLPPAARAIYLDERSFTEEDTEELNAFARGESSVEEMQALLDRIEFKDARSLIQWHYLAKRQVIATFEYRQDLHRRAREARAEKPVRGCTQEGNKRTGGPRSHSLQPARSVDRLRSLTEVTSGTRKVDGRNTKAG
jgi:hypothetical protein